MCKTICSTPGPGRLHLDLFSEPTARGARSKVKLSLPKKRKDSEERKRREKQRWRQK